MGVAECIALQGNKHCNCNIHRSEDGGKTWSSLRPIEEPETEIDCIVYGVEKKDDKVTKTS